MSRIPDISPVWIGTQCDNCRRNGKRDTLMDIAVNLVESYLRLTGYLTLSEFEVQARRPDGTFACC